MMFDSDTHFNPFPGLRSFEPDEDHLFFGREQRIDELLGRLRRTRFLAVVGTSGSGKSSLVRSGLIPSLYSGFMTKAGSSWRVAVFRPGDDPIGNLAEALNEPEVLGMEGEFKDTNRSLLEATLRRSTLGIAECVKGARVPPEENLLVLVDQFEELFRFKRNTRIKDSGDDAVAFVKLLLEAAQQEEFPIYIVITMRSDFIGNFTEFQGLAEAVNDGQYLVPRMTREERRSAIVGPVAVGGGEITPRLVLRILNDVGDNPDQLPTMQHALMRTWDHWRENHADEEAIDLRHYEAIGTISGALSQHAEEAFAELEGLRSKQIAELMFKALTDRASDNRGVRAPKRLSEICSIADADEEQVKAVIERFRAPGRSFLMPPVGTELHADSIIDISHESLMRVWTRLMQWVEEEARSVQVYLRISKAAAQYQEGKAGLFRDPELQLALNWRAENKPTAAWAERYDAAFDRAMVFLEHSEKQRDLELAEKERQRRRQLQWARRLAVVLGSAAILTLVFGLYAMTLKIEADKQRAIAVEQMEIAEEQRLEAERQKAAADEQREQAVQARTVADEQRELAEEQKELAEEQRRIAVLQRQRAIEQEQEALRQKQEAEAARVQEAEARGEAEEQRQIALQQKELADDARTDAEVSEAEAQRLRKLSVARGLAIQTSRLGGEEQHELAALLAIEAFLMHQRNGGDPADADIFEALRATHARLAPAEVQVIRSHHDSLRCVAPSPSSGLVATGSDDGSVRLFDLSVMDGAPRVIAEPGVEVRSLTWIDGGTRLAVGFLDGTIRLFSTAAGATESTILYGHGASVTALAADVADGVLVSATQAGEVRLWRLDEADAGIALRSAGGGRVNALVITPDGGIAAATEDSGLLLWDLSQPMASPRQLLSDRDLVALAAAPDGSLAVGTREGPILMMPSGMAGEPKELAGHTSAVTSLSFAPGGVRLASGSLDGTVRLWDVEQVDREPIAFSGHAGWVWAVAFVDDGRRIVSGGADRSLRSWPTRPAPLAEAMCERLDRDLSMEEWTEYLPEDLPWEASCASLGAGAR